MKVAPKTHLYTNTLISLLLSFLVSIARRLQDPLVELVKIEPQHIGVGMYQHDIAESKLKARLDSILTECVSFVGVEINHVNQHVLRCVFATEPTPLLIF